jgi:YD repeat-containing protein
MRCLFRKSLVMELGLRRSAATMIALVAPLLVLGILISSRPARAQSCSEQSNCPGIIWYTLIRIDGTCFQNAGNQYSACLDGVPQATPGQLLGGVACCLSQFDLALCACPPPDPPPSAGPPPKPPVGAAPAAPVPGSSCDAGENADPGTGTFAYQQTDLALADVMPIQLARSYRETDTSSRAFGTGMALNYDLEIVTDPSGNYSYVDLVLPNGAQLYYPRVSPGNDFLDGVYQHTSSPTIYFGSAIIWNGNAWVLTRKDGTTMTFGSEALLTSITDRNGNTVQIQRNEGSDTSTDNATLITSPNGRSISLTYDSRGRVVSAQDNTGRTVWYVYNSNGQLSTVYDANGGTTTYAYGSAGTMTSFTTPDGNVHASNQYNSNNQVTQQTMPDGSSYSFNYNLDSGGNLIQTDVISPLGTTNSLTFNPNGYILNNMVASGTAVEQDYAQTRDPNTNLITSTTDALGRVTNYTYDSMGNQTSVTRMAGTLQAVTSSTTYDPNFSQPTSTTDALGHTWTYTLDGHGNQIAMTDPDGHQTTTTYNSSGQPVSSTDAAGNTTTYGYTGGLLTSITDPVGNTTSYVYDSAGRMIRSIDPLSNSTTNIYDNLGNLTQTINALGATTSFTYDAERNRTSITDANGGTIRYAYDSMNRLISATDPLGATEHYSYDANGRLAQFADRRNTVTVFQYDAQNRKTFAGFGYNGSGYASTISYQYDNGDRLTQVVDSAAGTITRSYDNFDNLIEEQTPQGEITYSYDADHRLLTRTVVGETPVSYSWDNAGNPLSAVQGGSSLAYAYDGAGRLSSMTLPNGVVVAYSYDGDSRIAEIAYSNGSGPLGNLTYAYDADGRVVTRGGSLASIVMPQSVTGNTFNTANEMTAFNGQPLTYDPNGNLLNDGTNIYTWDSRNDLASLAGPTPAGFTYDSFGRRVNLTVNGGTTQYMYEDGGMLTQEISPAGVHLLSGLGISRLDSEGAMTFLSDERGSVIALTEPTGAIQTQYEYDPSGAVLVSGAASTNPFQFEDMQNDSTGLYYRSSRYYDPAFALGIGGGAVATGENDFTNLSNPNSANDTSPGNGSCDKCRAELKYHLIDYPIIRYFHYNHAFWDIHMAIGGAGTIYSGQPSKFMDGTYSPLHPSDFGYLARYEWADNDPGPSGVTDNSSNPDSYDSSCNSDVCEAAQLLDLAASLWPQQQIAYSPAGGPNSNTLANHLGLCGGFPNGPAPDTTGLGGWSNAVAQGVPCL